MWVALMLIGSSLGAVPESGGTMPYQYWEYRRCTAAHGFPQSIPCYRNEPEFFRTLEAVVTYLNKADVRAEEATVLRCEEIVLKPQKAKRTVTRTETIIDYRWTVPE